LEEKISRATFIRLGSALGVGAAGASVLGACGGSGGGESGSGGSDGGGSGAGGAGGSTGAAGGGSNGARGAGGQAIARTSEVAPGSAVEFEDSGSPAVLVHLNSGDFVAYSAVCTHQQCTVA
jgi:cytochrome b6-f complex iron-sulfur subunit